MPNFGKGKRFLKIDLAVWPLAFLYNGKHWTLFCPFPFFFSFVFFPGILARTLLFALPFLWLNAFKNASRLRIVSATARTWLQNSAVLWDWRYLGTWLFHLWKRQNRFIHPMVWSVAAKVLAGARFSPSLFDLAPRLTSQRNFAVMIITWWCLEPYLDQCYEPFSSFHFPKLIVNLLPIFWNVWRRNHWNNTTCFLFSFTAYPFCSALVAHFPYFLQYKKWKNRSHYDMTV